MHRLIILIVMFLLTACSLYPENTFPEDFKTASADRNSTRPAEVYNSNLTEQLILNWNGTAWENSSKLLIKYTLFNKKDNEILSAWNGKEWQEFRRTFYTYNSSEMLLSIYTKVLPFNWDILDSSTMKYDDKDREIERIIKFWNQELQRYSQMKVLKKYSADNLSEEINQNIANNSWVNSTRVIYKYDPANNMNERLTQDWINDNWKNNSSYNYIFDENRNKIKSFQLHWSRTSWDTLNMHSFTYKETNKLIQEFRKVKQNNIWINDYITSYEYDSLGNLAIKRFQYWSDKVLINSNVVYYEYDEKGHVTQEMELGWKNNDWEGQVKINYVYDSDGNLIQKTYNSWSNGNWTNTVRYIYSYENTSDIENESAEAARFHLEQNFPNPFNPITTISYSITKESHVELRIYDMLGREVSILVNEQKPSGEYKAQFNGSSLPSGVYIYTIQAGSYRDSKKSLLLK